MYRTTEAAEIFRPIRLCKFSIESCGIMMECTRNMLKKTVATNFIDKCYTYFKIDEIIKMIR